MRSGSIATRSRRTNSTQVPHTLWRRRWPRSVASEQPRQQASWKGGGEKGILLLTVWNWETPFHTAVFRMVLIPREMTHPSPKSIQTCGWVPLVSVLPHRVLKVLLVPYCMLLNLHVNFVVSTVDFDTGSADLVLPNKTCDSNCEGHTLYDPTASSTSVDIGTTFELAYRGGSNVNGTQYADNVYMGGYEVLPKRILSATPLTSTLLFLVTRL